MVQHIFGKFLRLRMGQILTEPFGIQTHLIHADEADGGEVVIEASQVSRLVYGYSPFIQKLGDHHLVLIFRERAAMSIM